MAKQTLNQEWIFAGKRYGPGEVDLPDDAAEALKARGAFGDEPTAAEAAHTAALAAAIDPEQIEAGEKEAAPARLAAARADAKAQQAQADAASKRAK
jgi:hypothetical protein